MTACQIRIDELFTEYQSRVDAGEFDNLRKDNRMTDIESAIWKLEIDIENIGDIITRIERAREPKWTNKVKSWFMSKVNDLF